MRVHWSQQQTQDLPTVTTRPRTARPARPALRRRRRLLVAGAVVLGIVGLVVAASAGALDRIPLLNAPAAILAEVAGGGLLITAWWRRDRRWLGRTLPVTVAAVGLLVGLIALLLWVTGTVTDAYPPSFALWVGACFTAIAACPLVLRQRDPGAFTRLRKLAALTAVPLTLAGGFMLIDQEYGIWPQFGDVLDHFGAVNGEKGLHDLIAGAHGPGGAPAEGVIVKLDAPATVSHFPHRPGVVFLPPGYFTPDGPDLPVLVMLVGAPGTPINWLKAGHGQATDNAYAATHGGLAPVLVVVDQNGSAIGDTECVDGPKGNAETYVAVDVPAFITGTLHMRHDPEKWGIVGFSEGGTCALTLVLRHPDVYRHFVDFGGDARPNLGNPKQTLANLYGGNVAAVLAHDPAHLLATHRYRGVTAWFGAGVEDTRGITTGERMALLTRRDGIPTHSFIGIGGHSWLFASYGLAEIFPTLCDELGCVGAPLVPGPQAATTSMPPVPPRGRPPLGGRTARPSKRPRPLVIR